MRTIFLSLVLLSGCTTAPYSTSTYSASTDAVETDWLPSEGITVAQATVDQGNFHYAGRASTPYSADFDLSVYSQYDRSSVSDYWAAGLDRNVAWMDGYSQSATFDFDVQGPDLLNLDLLLNWGTATVEEVAGEHIITADRIVSTRLIGSAVLEARSMGMDVEIWPYTDGSIYIVSRGDVTLRLPYGGDYDIEVWGDPAYEMTIDDLGFHNSTSDYGYFSGVVGWGGIRIDVYVEDGSFSLVESW